jgi:hypothetical protein
MERRCLAVRSHVLWRRWLCSVLFSSALCSCNPDGYPIDPTLCDDWCFATQRAQCSEDDPERCVSECERSATGRMHPECEPEWVSLTECYRAEPQTSFICTPGEGTSAPREVCLSERAALAGCVSSGASTCFENCVTEVNECGGRLVTCEQSCTHPAAGCEVEQQELDECKVGKPVYCGGPEEDSRKPEDIPCLAEIGALLECAGWPGTSAESVSL